MPMVVRGFTEARDYVSRAGGTVDEAARQMALALMAEGRTLARANVQGRPGPDRWTGVLEASITTEGPAGGDGKWAGSVFTNAVQARILELGGTITPKNGEFLTFKTMDGSWHKVRSVTIPAYPYWAPAAEELETRIPAMADLFFEEVFPS